MRPCQNVFSESVTYSRFPVAPMYNFLQYVKTMQSMTLAQVHVKWSVILMDLLGPDIFSTLLMKVVSERI